jgi:hypothetical protein
VWSPPSLTSADSAVDPSQISPKGIARLLQRARWSREHGLRAWVSIMRPVYALDTEYDAPRGARSLRTGSRLRPPPRLAAGRSRSIASRSRWAAA